jgi:hypothetical protein
LSQFASRIQKYTPDSILHPKKVLWKKKLREIFVSFFIFCCPMIGQLWHRVLCHAVVRNVQDFGVMEFSKHEDFAHINITVTAIQIGEYNQDCGTTSLDLRQQTSLALLFQN